MTIDLKDILLKLDKMNDNLSDMRECVARIDVHTGENTRNIHEHIRRTNLLEEKVNLLRVQLVGQKKVFTAASWALGSISTILGILWVTSKLLA